MDPASLNHLRDAIIGQGGVVLLFIIAFFAGHKQVWCWGREVKERNIALSEMTTDRNMWRDRYIVDMEALKKELRDRLSNAGVPR